MPSKTTAAPHSRRRQPHTVSVLERGLAVLGCIEASSGPLGNGDIARLTRIPKPTVTRLVATLVARGFLRLVPGSEKYTLGARVITLAQAFLAGLDVRSQARPHMMELAERGGGWSYLGARNGVDMVLIETCRSRSGVLLSRLDIGSRVPLVNSALGRAYLSALPARERSGMVRQMQSAHPEQWPRLHASLQRALKEAALRGFCLSAGEWHRDVNSIAVPLRIPGGELMALNFGGPAFAFPADRLRREIGPRILETVQRIERDIGSQAADSPAPERATRLTRAAKGGEALE